RVDAVVIFELGDGLAGYHATREDDARIVGQPRLCRADQRILAGPGGADDENKCTRTRHQLTRRPCRHTPRTTGAVSALRTRTRSARMPTAISPRSSRCAARAGLRVTSPTDSGSEIPSTTSGSWNAAIISENGT